MPDPCGLTWREARKTLFPKLTLSQVEALLWECTPYPMTDLDDMLLYLEVIAGVHAAGEPFDELMFLFGSDLRKTCGDKGSANVKKAEGKTKHGVGRGSSSAHAGTGKRTFD